MTTPEWKPNLSSDVPGPGGAAVGRWIRLEKGTITLEDALYALAHEINRAHNVSVENERLRQQIEARKP